MLEHNNKFFTLDLNGRKDTVSVDRLKVAYGHTEPAMPPLVPTVTTKLPRLTVVSKRQHPIPAVLVRQTLTPPPTSRCGRSITVPLRFQ